MTRRQLINLPDNINPGGFLMIKLMSEILNISESTVRNWRRKPGNGLRWYRVNGVMKNGKLTGGILVVKCDEFCAWLNLVAVEVAQVRRITFTSESKVRGNGLPRRLHAKQA